MSNPDMQAALAKIQQLEASLAAANAEGHKVVGQLQVAQQAAAAAAAAGASSPRKSHSRLKIPAPSAFKGEMGNAADTWLRSVQKQFSFYGANSVEFPDALSQVRFAAMHLEGPALEWWDQLPSQSTIVTFAEFEKALRARFRPMQAAHVARQRIASLKQRGRVSGYCNTFLTELVPIKDMSAADQVFFFRQGLDTQLALEVLKKDPKTLHDAMEVAVAAEAYLGRGMGGGSRGTGYFTPSSGHSSGGARASANDGATPMDLNNVNLEYNAYEGETAPAAGSSSSAAAAAAASTVETTALLAMMQQMQHQLLALQQPKPNVASGKVPGLKAGDIDRLRTEGRCFNCKEKGHSKRDCNKPLRLKW